MPRAESPLFARTYDLLRWLIPLTVRFPREQRFVLAAAVQQAALRFHDRLIDAVHIPPDALLATLAQASADLDKLRHALRLCHDLTLITSGQYEYAAERTSEIGRLLGGWRKAVERSASDG
jgi:hypothetical protein